MRMSWLKRVRMATYRCLITLSVSFGARCFLMEAV